MNKRVFVESQKGFRFVLGVDCIKPARRAGDFIRQASRDDVRKALTSKSRLLPCTGGHCQFAVWGIYRRIDGSVKVGCQVFDKKTVAIIRRWALAKSKHKKTISRKKVSA